MNIEFDHIFSAESISVESLDTLSALDLQYFPTPWKASDWKEIFTNVSRMLTVVRSPKEIIGFALFDNNAVDSFAHLLKIVIIPRNRSKGLGEKVLKSSLDALKQREKIFNIFLEVEVSNFSAINLYKKMDFEIIHSKKDFYGAGKDAYIMTANLDK
jgi:ribosomal-protein-alanine N-acetyltransferase